MESLINYRSSLLTVTTKEMEYYQPVTNIKIIDMKLKVKRINQRKLTRDYSYAARHKVREILERMESSSGC